MPSLKRKLDDIRRAGKAKGQKKMSFGLASGSINQVS